MPGGGSRAYQGNLVGFRKIHVLLIQQSLSLLQLLGDLFPVLGQPEKSSSQLGRRCGGGRFGTVSRMDPALFGVAGHRVSVRRKEPLVQSKLNLAGIPCARQCTAVCTGLAGRAPEAGYSSTHLILSHGSHR